MSSGICSQALVFATAMVVSSTVIFLTFSRQKTSPPKQILRSCLSSEGKKGDKKKKKVHFAENVKKTSGNGEEYRKEHNKKLIATTATKAGRSKKVDSFCRNEAPENWIALYNGILRDRLHKIECSY